MLNSRYTWRESALRMTQCKRFASAIANPDFPVAVGPHKTTKDGIYVLFFAKLGLAEDIDENLWFTPT